jgi:hypothetical protein
MQHDRIQYGLPGAHEPTPEEIEAAMKRGERERAQMFGEIARAAGAWLARVDPVRNGAFAQVPVTRASA